MKICIYGAGAVGGLMAGWLARAGHAASVVARGANLTAIRDKGLRVRSEGKETAFKVQADWQMLWELDHLDRAEHLWHAVLDVTF